MAILYDNEGNQITMSEVNANASDIADLKSRMTTAEGDITAAEGNITSLDGRLDIAEPKISTFETTSAGLVANKEILGAKNLLPSTLSNLKASNTSGTWVGNAYTLNDVTFTVNTDSLGSVTDITVNGTASSNTLLNIPTDLTERVILSGCPSGGSSTTYELQYYIQYGIVVHDYGDGADFTAAGTGGLTVVIIRAGYTATDLTFNPMIRLATDNNPTFEPYAMSNQELTAKVLDLITRVTALES